MERRFLSDRRRHPRGGRRPYDQSGYSPLVMVIESDSSRRAITETILSRLRFAVAPIDSVEKAVAIIRALRPAVVVCGEAEAEILREDAGDPPIPIVTPCDEPDALVESIRFAIRARVIPIA